MSSNVLIAQSPEATETDWLLFINEAMSSDIFLNTIQDGHTIDEAASIVLLDNYFHALSHDQKESFLKDESQFYNGSKEFVGIMKPFKYQANHSYDHAVRSAYMGMIKRLLASQKHQKETNNRWRYHFIRNVVKFTSSADYILKAYRLYKKYLNDHN